MTGRKIRNIHRHHDKQAKDELDFCSFKLLLIASSHRKYVTVGTLNVKTVITLGS